MRKRIAKVIMKKGKGGWYFKIKAKNGKTLCHSESYYSKKNCRIGAEAVLRLTKIEEVE